jgi:hypothetical protein
LPEEQEEQELLDSEDFLRTFPKQLISFLISLLLQDGQITSPVEKEVKKIENSFPQERHMYS